MMCYICREPIAKDEIIRRVEGKGLAHKSCIDKQQQPSPERMRPLTAAEQYDQDRITRVT